MSSRKGQILPIAFIAAVLIGAGATVALTDIGNQNQKASIVTGSQAYISQFGETGVVGSFDMTKVSFDDGEQETAGSGTVNFSLSQVANETVKSASSTSDQGYIQLANDDLESGTQQLWNLTDNTKISSSKYTMNYTDGGIDLDSSIEVSNTKLGLTYNYMPEQTGTTVAEIYFDIEGGSAGATLTWEWAGNSINDSNTQLRTAFIKNTDTGRNVEVPTGSLENENTVNINALNEGDHRLYLFFDHSKGTETTPTPSRGTVEEIGNIDFKLESNAQDQPTEVEDFKLKSKTVAP